MNERVAGVILAGGRSSRMGGSDKCLSLLSDRPILAHVSGRLKPQVHSMVLNANGDPSRFAATGLPVVPDPLPDMGPLGGVLAGLRWAQHQDLAFTHVVTVACDTPFLPLDLVARMQEAASAPDCIVQSRSGERIHPTFALWPVVLTDDLKAFLLRGGSASMRAYAGELHRPSVVDFAIEGELDPFFNVNTPEDLERARSVVEKAR